MSAAEFAKKNDLKVITFEEFKREYEPTDTAPQRGGAVQKACFLESSHAWTAYQCDDGTAITGGYVHYKLKVLGFFYTKKSNWKSKDMAILPT